MIRQEKRVSCPHLWMPKRNGAYLISEQVKRRGNIWLSAGTKKAVSNHEMSVRNGYGSL